MAEEVGKLTIALSFDNKSLDSSVKQTENTVTSGFTAMKGAMAVLIAQGAAAAAGAITDFGKSVVQTGMQFDTAMSQVAATMGTTVDQIGDLSAVAQEMGATTKFTATEAAEGLNILAMAGLNAQDQIAGIPTVLDLASAGAMSLESAASYVVGAVNGFSDSMENAQYYADLMAKGATLANTSVSGLGEAFSRSAATAASYGQEADGVTLSLLRLASQNVTGEAAATALNRAMADLYTPTKAAAEALADLNISVYDSNGAAKDFNSVVDELSVALSGMSAEEANAYKATIFTTQGLNAFNKMTAISSDDVNRLADGIENAFGSAAEQARVQIDNLEGSMTILGSSFEGVQLSVYNSLKPALLDGANGLLDFAGTLSAVINGADPSMLISGFIEKFGRALFNGMSQIGTTIGKVAPVLVQAIMGLLPELVNGAISMFSNFAEEVAKALPDLLTSIIDSIIDTIMALTDPGNIERVMNVGLSLFMALIDAIPQIVAQLADRLPLIITGIIQAFTQSQTQVFEAAVTLLNAIVDAIPQIIPPLVASLPEILNAIIGGLLEAIPQLIEAAITLLMAIVQAIPVIIEALVAELPNIIMTIVDVLIENIPLLLDAAITVLMAIIDAIPIIIEALIPMVPTIVTTIISALIEHAPELLNGALELLGTILEGIAQIVPKVLEAAGNIVGGIVEGLKNGIGAVGEAIGNVGSSIVDGFKSFFGIHSPSTVMADQANYLTAGLVNGLSGMSIGTLEVFNEVSAATMEWGTSFAEVGVEVGNLFIESFMTTLMMLPETIMTLFTSIVEYFAVWSEQLLTTLTVTTQQIMAVFTQWLTNLLQQIQNIIAQLTNLAKQFCEQALQWSGQFGEEFQKQILEKPLELPDKFDEIGVDIIKGLEAGMRRQEPSLMAYVDSLCARIVAKIQSAMQIHSPSAVMRDEVGVFLAQGIGVGFGEEMEKVNVEMAESVELPTTASNDTSGLLGSILRNLGDDEDVSSEGFSEPLTVVQNNTINNQLDIQQVSEALLEEIRRI